MNCGVRRFQFYYFVFSYPSLTQPKLVYRKHPRNVNSASIPGCAILPRVLGGGTIRWSLGLMCLKCFYLLGGETKLTDPSSSLLSVFGPACFSRVEQAVGLAASVAAGSFAGRVRLAHHCQTLGGDVPLLLLLAKQGGRDFHGAERLARHCLRRRVEV